jgi:hypothetical protein
MIKDWLDLQQSGLRDCLVFETLVTVGHSDFQVPVEITPDQSFEILAKALEAQRFEATHGRPVDSGRHADGNRFFRHGLCGAAIRSAHFFSPRHNFLLLI